MNSLANKCADIIHQAKSIAVLTGAGISTSAGIPDFRGPQGLYVTRRYDPETVFDIHHFHRDPQPFYEFARDFISLVTSIQPTDAHRFLAALEKQGRIKGIITQNIDALHQRAGSNNVLEMHGSFWKGFCLGCGAQYKYDILREKIIQEEIPLCSCGGVIKPDIIFFGENVKHYEKCVRLVEESDLLMVIGTSCAVQPAASLPLYARKRVVVINLTHVNLPFGNLHLQVNRDIDEFFKEVLHFSKN